MMFDERYEKASAEEIALWRQKIDDEAEPPGTLSDPCGRVLEFAREAGLRRAATLKPAEEETSSPSEETIRRVKAGLALKIATFDVRTNRVPTVDDLPGPAVPAERLSVPRITPREPNEGYWYSVDT